MSDAARRQPRDARPANQRGVARLAAVQALYQMEIGGGDAADVVAEFELFRLGKEIDGEQYRAADAAWFRDLVAGVVLAQREIDPLVHQALTHDWPLGRVDSILRAILRAGVYELLHRTDVPAKVVITEYIDVAKAFFTEDEPRIVNGVLDRIAHERRAAEFDAAGSA
ncbi:transcription antitermination factor NusB [Segnochrobactrum spirostomi]|uniref:Transcription antitermination protein NusB n=1 Tax=Segnochrobactrum spirostomi TaxID=2608987 RepID=A0A6A7Y4M7_9HYPH|nr:transcription antitermination factor NusB [Segnochrobactrum spirostomi]MQT13696.1 transcription antitermination factor NusB [Segnochrobactrum spirostomi]